MTGFQGALSDFENLDPFHQAFFFCEGMHPDVMGSSLIGGAENENNTPFSASNIVSGAIQKLIETTAAAADQAIIDISSEGKPSKTLKNIAKTLDGGYHEALTLVPHDDDFLTNIMDALKKIKEVRKEMYKLYDTAYHTAKSKIV